MKKSVLILGLALASSGCMMPFTHRVEPVIALSAVERPATARQQWGEQLIATRSDSGVTRYSFEDAMIRAVFLVRESDVLMDLTNKTQFSLRLLWTETTMVLPEGSPSPVMMNGWKYTDCRAEKPPAVIPKGVTISDVIIPCARLSFSSNWIEAPLFPGGTRYANDSTVSRVTEEMRKQMLGKSVSLLLPLQIEGVTNEYTFRFSVDSVNVRRNQ